ncbi:DUF2232 domain-containing protein [Clostridium oceanicum]|uniref:YybS family protein n=1 Tax=Clostridium oceanicum TaxID=1543 RepID=A0ABP3V306_9CLOT
MENRQIKIKRIIETAMMIALMVILSVINVYLPIGQVILPIPVTVIYIRNGFKYSLSSIILTGIITSMIFNPITGLVSILASVIGLILGYCIKNNIKMSKTLVFLGIGFIIIFTASFLLAAFLINGKDLFTMVDEIFKPLRDSLDTYKAVMPNEETAVLINQYKEVLKTENVLKMLPGVLISSSFILGYIDYIVTVYILKKLRYKNIKEAKSFSYIHINIKVGTIIGICLLLGSVLERFNISLGEYIFIGSLSILQFIFIINGIACFVYYAKNKFKMSKGIMIFILIITLFSPISMIYIFTGLIDMVFDFRKLDSFRSYKKR